MKQKKRVINNIPVKKISYEKRKGYVIVKLYDGHHNKIYDGKANLNNRQEVKQLKEDIVMKGFELFEESSWL